MLPLQQHLQIQWSDVLVFSVSSPASSLLWSPGDAKKPTHLSQRVGHKAPGVVLWSWSVVLSWLTALRN